MLDRAQSIFCNMYKSTPAIETFLHGDNLRQLHAALQHALNVAYRSYQQEPPLLLLNDDFVKDAMQFAKSQLHLFNNTVQSMNAAYVDQYVQPIKAHLYWSGRNQTHLDEAKSCGRSQVYRRYYSNKQVPHPALPATPQQLPALSTVSYQTSLFRFPLSGRSRQCSPQSQGGGEEVRGM